MPQHIHLNLFVFSVCRLSIKNNYLNSVSLRNGMKRAEIGEFEERNGRRVYVIRGFFQHVVNDVS